MIVPGLGSGPWDWDAVLARLPVGPTVRFVDPGCGRGTDWRTGAVAARMREELAAERGPFVLVGHSNGALAVQAFGYRYPSDCVAAVLVDGSHARARPGAPPSRWLARVPRPRRLRPARCRALADSAAAVGLVSLLGPTVRRIGVRAMSVLGRDPLTSGGRRRHYGTRDGAHALVDAWFGHAVLQADVLRCQAGGPPAIPVTVLVGTARPGRRGPDRRWAAVQADLAMRLGADGPVLLSDAAHLVPLDRPDAVAAAIREALEAS